MSGKLSCCQGILIASLLLVCFPVWVFSNDMAPAAHREHWTESRVVGFPDPPLPFQVRQVFTNVDLPKALSVTTLPGTDDLLVTVHQGGYGGPGRLLRLTGDDSTATISEFLQIPDIIYGIAFHPDFATNGYMFVGCNGRSEVLETKATRVLRFQVSRTAPFACDPKSETVIIEWKSNGHNGGDLVFGHDGMLYVSAGDGTSDSDAKHAGQDLTTIPGSMIRIDVDHPANDMPYSVPPDNPFLDVKEARPEIWAYGFRNPWRICVDAQTGDLWAGINGQDLWETAQVVRRGENYGWSITEGSHPFQPNRKHGPTPIVAPTIEHPHSEARSLTGGHVYYGSKYPSLQGHYIYGDYSTGMIWAAKYHNGAVVSHFVVARTSLQITGFGIDHAGELLIVDYGSGLYRLIPNAQTNHGDFPRKLSQTGIFTSVTDHRVAPGIVAYEVNAPLWSDGAAKHRFIGLPGATTIGFAKGKDWEYPDGTVFVKTFSLPLAGGTADQWTRIETRLMTQQDGEWYGYSYEWNDDQTDATLVDAPGKFRELSLQADDSVTAKKQIWQFPSRADCMVCHTRAANFVLGFSASQLNRNVAQSGVDHSQLESFAMLGLFKSLTESTVDAGPTPAATQKFQLPSSVAELPHLDDPNDITLSLESRVRSYLHANCAVCHVNAGGGNSRIDLSYGGGIDKTKLVNETPLHGAFDIADAKLVVPGHPERSLLLYRMRHRGRGQMPPLATSVVDQRATEMIGEWIKQMPLTIDTDSANAPE
ncbi:MAG: PQQ-dependent sugar dehydrogenase [Planctomycetaceae bacterium]|nr:PQQ-dependent sugar dehydrogenase [Planctomycetaceae bacterium]